MSHTGEAPPGAGPAVAEALRSLSAQVTGLLDGQNSAAQLADSAAGAGALLSSAVRLYAAVTDGRAGPLYLDVTPTQACSAAAALLRSQDLTPFEFSIWMTGA